MSSGDDYPAGGSITDMATTGTSIPSDSGTQRVIRSVPNPAQEQQADNPDYNQSGDLAGAATNATDIPRSTRDTAASGEVETIGRQSIGAAVESKRLTTSKGNEDLAKGSLRMEKHARQQGSDLERRAGDGPGVEAAPGEEEEDQETLRDRREQ